MIPVVLAILLVGTQAQLPNLIGAVIDPVVREPITVGNLLSRGIFRNKFNPVDTVAKVVKKGTLGLVDVTREARKEDMGGVGRAANDVVEKITIGVKKEVGAITQPMASLALTTATARCAPLKKLLGVDSYSLSSLNDADLNRLTLNYYSPRVQIAYNLTDAAVMLSKARHYDPSLPLIIFAHGFLSDPTFDSFAFILDAFHKKGEYNVLAIDSSEYIGWFYLRSSTYVQFIGEKLGGVLAAMVQLRGLSPKSIHLIGYSLGAHIAGFAGKEFTRLTGLRVGRISGLDAAGPCFYDVGSNMKLQAADADFVDVIHTSHGTLGLTEPVGHVDFYPNGGTQQPNCISQTCNHERVWALYAESISNERAFIAVKCAGWDQFRNNQCEKQEALMGYGCSPDTRGLYFLNTRGTSPFGLGYSDAIHNNHEGIFKKLQLLGPGAPFG